MVDGRRIPSFGAERTATLFAGADGALRFARWGRPLAPAVPAASGDPAHAFRLAVTAETVQ